MDQLALFHCCLIEMTKTTGGISQYEQTDYDDDESDHDDDDDNDDNDDDDEVYLIT